MPLLIILNITVSESITGSKNVNYGKHKTGLLAIIKIKIKHWFKRNLLHYYLFRFIYIFFNWYFAIGRKLY